MGIMTITPFRGQADVNLCVAYISVTIMFFMVRKHIPYSPYKHPVFMRVSPFTVGNVAS